MLDIEKVIISNLDDESLSQAASINSYTNCLMNESFWTFRFHNKYGVTLWKYGISHRDIYREFSKLHGDKIIKRVIDYNFIELLESLE